MSTPTPPSQPDPDAALRRQLRFSLFLQGFAALMMGGAAVIRIVSLGWDALSIVLALAFDFTNGFHDTGNAMATLSLLADRPVIGATSSVTVIELSG